MPVDLETIRRANDLVAVVREHIPLRRVGRRWLGKCPFHEEKTPSFNIDPAKQLWKCFGCQLGGDVFRFVELRLGVPFPEAKRALAERAGLDVGPCRSRAPTTLEDYHVRAAADCADFWVTIRRRLTREITALLAFNDWHTRWGAELAAAGASDAEWDRWLDWAEIAILCVDVAAWLRWRRWMLLEHASKNAQMKTWLRIRAADGGPALAVWLRREREQWEIMQRTWRRSSIPA